MAVMATMSMMRYFPRPLHFIRPWRALFIILCPRLIERFVAQKNILDVATKYNLAAPTPPSAKKGKKEAWFWDPRWLQSRSDFFTQKGILEMEKNESDLAYCQRTGEPWAVKKYASAKVAFTLQKDIKDLKISLINEYWDKGMVKGMKGRNPKKVDHLADVVPRVDDFPDDEDEVGTEEAGAGV